VPVQLLEPVSPKITQASKRKSHVKFGSESPLPAPEVEEEQPAVESEEENEDSTDDDDDDEAPEAISHSHAEATTKATQAVEARLVKRREQEAREKRRERDAQLKAQVKSSEKRQSRGKREQLQSDDEDERSPTKIATAPKYDMNDLPALLPDELLAMEAPARLPTPPPADTRSGKLQKLGHSAIETRVEEVPADVIHNGTKIRVLQTSNKLLPPKADGETRSMREAWLQGRASFEKIDKRGSNVSKVRRRVGPRAFV
jgi:hypothetical protein